MKIKRKHIIGYSNDDNVKTLDVSTQNLAEYIRTYLDEQWGIYTFSCAHLNNQIDEHNLEVYKMQFTPFISEIKLKEAINALDDATIKQLVEKSFVATKTETIATDEPTDWEDYWEYQSKLSGSFASENLADAKIEKADSYKDIVSVSDSFKKTFPNFSTLLSNARVTKITTKTSKVFYLLGWSYEYGHFGGLMPEIETKSSKDIHNSHQLLLNNFGGFIDWFGELVDSNYFSYADQVELNLEYITPSKDLPNDFVQFTEEANGDFYCYHKKNAEVWKFCHEGYQELIMEEYGSVIQLLQTQKIAKNLFQLDNCSFVDWIERGAKSWLNCFEKHPYED